MKNALIPLVTVAGPTACGKSRLAVQLAKFFIGEIISCDSMQIYKEFEISTARPTALQLSEVPHHLTGFLSINQEFSAAKYAELAHNCINEVHKRENLPFLVGGTGLYMDAVTKNIMFEDNREAHAKKVFDFSNLEKSELWNLLCKIDSVTAQNLHPNDTKRIKRAIEFFYTSGYSISEQVARSKNALARYDICKLGLDFKNRQKFYDIINSRVDDMIEKGLANEIKKAFLLRPSKTAEAAIGYKEILPFVMGKCMLSEAADNLKRATRRYAKRQLTWFRRDKSINWIFVDDYSSFEDVVGSAKNIIKKFIKLF